MKNKVTYDEKCKTRSNGKLVTHGVYPFPNADRKGQLDIPCFHAMRVTCLVEGDNDGTYYGVVAMAANEQVGLIAAYDAKALREMAKSFENMADHVDQKNNEMDA